MQCCPTSIKAARSKTQKPRKYWKYRKFFSEIFKSEFTILVVGQNWEFGKKKTRNNISRSSEISKVSEFSICYFFIFQKTFSFQYSTVDNSVLYIYVMFWFQSLLKCFFPSPKICAQSITMIHLLWDVYILMRTWGVLIWNSMKCNGNNNNLK